jgi:uncharacterized protein Yka (UPF0111/DUF47 family)
MKSHWFLPETPDVLGTLGEQAEITVAGIGAFAAWAHGDLAQEAQVRAAEHDADRVRRELQLQLRRAFSTPIDQEDLYTLSELLDSVINSAKNIVREAELLALLPDAPTAAMVDEMAKGVTHVRTALGHLTDDGDIATSEADLALATERKMEKIYRQAMRELLAMDDFRKAMSLRELYRRVLEAGERLAAVAERIWYAVVKQA